MAIGKDERIEIRFYFKGFCIFEVLIEDKRKIR